MVFCSVGFAEEISVPSILEKLQKLAEREEARFEQNPEILPSFYGERYDTSLQGSISGLNSSNLFDIGQMFYAASEGLLNHVHNMISADFLINLGISRLLVSGSVVMKNSILKQRLMKLYSKPSLQVVMTNDGNDAVGSAIGAALVILKNVFNQDGK